MADTDYNEEQTEQNNGRKDPDQLSQIALGNDAVEITPERNNNDLLSVPKTSGTGSNPTAAAPESLIVHDDKTGKERYEDGTKDKPTDDE